MVGLVLLMSGCEEQVEVNDMTFTINVLSAKSTFIYYDIYPQYDEFEYATFVVSSDRLNKLGSRALIDSVHATLTPEHVYNKGVRILADHLEPGKRYYICCYRLNSRHKPIYSLIKKPQMTEVKVMSDLTFDYKTDGTVITIIPSNNSDHYFWDYLLKEETIREYRGVPMYYFYYMLQYYENYDMVNYMLSQGEDSDDASIYYNFKDHDTLYVMASYYDIKNHCTPDPQVRTMVYHAEGDSLELLPYSPHF